MALLDTLGRLVQIGASADLPPAEARVLRATNAWALVILAINASYAVVAGLSGVWQISLSHTSTAVICGFAMWLNRAGWRPAAAHLIMFVGLWQVSLSVWLFGYASGSAVFYAMGVLAGYMVFPVRHRHMSHAWAAYSGISLIAATFLRDQLPARYLYIPVEQAFEINSVTFVVGMTLFAWAFTANADRLHGEVTGLRKQVQAFRQLGQFTLEDQIGAGGMGEVWRASHRMLARPAAVKLIRADQLPVAGEHRDRALQRFEREAQVTASLRSPHSVELYDFGVDEDGVFYYVMELLEGLDLQSLVHEYGPLPAERVVHLLVQACHSLHEAHSVGLVHRDIKPANLFTCRYGADVDFLKVLDFGLVALDTDRGTDEAEPLTIDGNILGTPAYLAPEMADRPELVDGRADLYALGCVAYFLLTGREVFLGQTAMQVVMAHMSKEPEPPSQVCELPIPVALEEVVLACLAKQPAERPQAAEELAVRLVAAVPDTWTADRAKAWWRSHRPVESAG